QLTGSTALDGLANFIDAGANLQLDAFANLVIDVGIDFSPQNVNGPTFFLYDYNPNFNPAVNPIEGTHLTVGARVLGTGLNLGFNLGPLQIGVRNGYFVLNADGDATHTGYATLVLAIDPKTGFNPN